MLGSTTMSSKGAGTNVFIAVIENEDAFYEGTRPHDVFFKIRIENSHEKSTLGLKRAKVLFLKRFFKRVLKN